MLRTRTSPSRRSSRSLRGGISEGDDGRAPTRDAGGGRGRPRSQGWGDGRGRHLRRRGPRETDTRETGSRRQGRRRRPGPAGGRAGVGTLGRDRKSTRLNSSHANISYAVFCLKKKKTHNTIKDLEACT